MPLQVFTLGMISVAAAALFELHIYAPNPKPTASERALAADSGVMTFAKRVVTAIQWSGR